MKVLKQQDILRLLNLNTSPYMYEMLINGSQETFCTCTTMPRAKVELRNNENVHVSCFLNLFIVRKGRKTAENRQKLTDADFDLWELQCAGSEF